MNAVDVQIERIWIRAQFGSLSAYCSKSAWEQTEHQKLTLDKNNVRVNANTHSFSPICPYFASAFKESVCLDQKLNLATADNSVTGFDFTRQLCVPSQRLHRAQMRRTLPMPHVYWFTLTSYGRLRKQLPISNFHSVFQIEAVPLWELMSETPSFSENTSCRNALNTKLTTLKSIFFYHSVMMK